MVYRLQIPYRLCRSGGGSLIVRDTCPGVNGKEGLGFSDKKNACYDRDIVSDVGWGEELGHRRSRILTAAKYNFARL